MGGVMNAGSWLDQVIVGALVFASAAFACYRLGPAGMRLWMRRQWARLLRRPVPVGGDGAAGCGGCGDCASTAPTGKPLGETRVAASNIHKFERSR
jgi:hypothetical protein